MKIALLAPCTGRKTLRPEVIAGPGELSRWLAGDRDAVGHLPTCSAMELYDGAGHRLLRRGVEHFRQNKKGTCTVHIVSAGLGLLKEDDRVFPYEMTFTSLRGEARARWVARMELAGAVSRWFREPADLRMILLGREYLDAAGLSGHVADCPTLVLAAPSAGDMIPGGAMHIPLGQPQAKLFRQTLIALKGELVRRVLFADNLWADPAWHLHPAWKDAGAFLDLCLRHE